MHTPRVDWPAVTVFGVCAVALSWLVALPLWLRGQGLMDPLLGVFAAGMMFTPALATIAALLVQRGRIKRSTGVAPRPRAVLRGLGMWPLRPLGRTLGMSAAMILVMPMLIVASLALMGALGLVTYDLTGFSGFAAAVETANPGGAALPVQAMVAIQLALIPVGAIVNIPFAFGEELGWRGWLLPALQPLGTWPALVVSGAFWGFWHAPLLLLGYNFAQPNALGILMMVVACMLFGVLLGWTRLRTASVWPATLAHSAFNTAAGLGVVVVAADSPVPPTAVASPLGVVMWVVFAAAIALLAVAGQFRRDRVAASLGPDPARAQPLPAPIG